MNKALENWAARLGKMRPCFSWILVYSSLLCLHTFTCWPLTMSAKENDFPVAFCDDIAANNTLQELVIQVVAHSSLTHTSY